MLFRSIILTANDIICLEMDGLGLLAVPGSEEPVPEALETVSHLRVVPQQREGNIDHLKCLFRIEMEFSQV